MSDQVEKSPGRPKGWHWPMSALMRAGIFGTLKSSEQIFVACLDTHTDHNTGVCWPSDKTIHEETGLCHLSIREARKSLKARHLLEYEMLKVNQRGHPVHHYRWLNIPSRSREDRADSQPSQPLQSSADVINHEGSGGIGLNQHADGAESPGFKPSLNLHIKKTLIESHKSPEKKKDEKPPLKARRSLTEYVNSVTLAGETRLTPDNIMKFIKATEAEVAAEELERGRRERLDCIANEKSKSKKCPWRL